MLIPDYTHKRLLIVDDQADMRSLLREQVSQLAIDKVSTATNVREALDHLKRQRFDIILCDYHLGGSTDGQQMLEFLRSRRLVSRATLFIMVTAEKSYEGVVTAAESLPDDYLLKPFTAEALRLRIDRLLAKKARLAGIDRMQDRGHWPDIVGACDEIIAANDKYLLDALGIKGNALLMSQQPEHAVQLYRQQLAIRPLPWAKLGLARALLAIGEHVEAKETLNAILVENPRFMVAYDTLSQVHAKEGNAAEALKILERAREVSPNSLARHRAIAQAAEDMGDYARVEQALSAVVKRTHFSPLREASDHSRLANALTELGEPAKAVEVLAEAKREFKEGTDARLLAAVEAVAQRKVGNDALAEQALTRALTGSAQKLPEVVALAVAKACLVHGRQAEGESLLKTVIQNEHEAVTLHTRVAGLMRAFGDPLHGKEFIEASLQEIYQLNNDAIAKGRAGDLAAASKMLADAANRLPNNLLIVSNAAYALLTDVLANGLDAAKWREGQRFEQAVLARNQRHPRLGEIADLIAKIRSKYHLAETP